MPLSEFLRMASRKTGSGQHKPFPTDLTSRSDHDLVELLWENGQITTQDQSSRARRTSPLNTNKPRAGKFTSGVDSILHDMSPIVVPSPDLDLSQDDDVSPWLDSLTQDYGSLLFPEISDVAPDDNVVSTQNSCLSVDKRDGSLQQSGLDSSNLGSSKASYSKDRLLCSCPPPPPQHRQASDILGSGLSGINSNIHPDVLLGNPAQSRDIASHTNNSSSYLNFSHFARPANLVKANVPKGSAGSGINPKGVVKSAKDSCASENLCLDDPSTQSNATESAAKGVVPCRERVVEHVVASSSVGSGNSGDRVSCEQTHNSKRKYRDIEESEGRSEDVGTESVGVEKSTLAGGKNGGSKRSRAAEVHNLSERKRRDRINEKMRALQELIPNCNKADKASMLDEAIEYLKTLQLQVQIMSMGAGLCMPQMMFPPGMQHMYPAQFPHFSPMGPSGMGMLDINSGCPVFPPVHAPQFSASLPTNFHRISSPNVPVYGHPFQGFSLTGNSAVGLSGLRSGSQNVGPGTSPVLNSGDVTNMNSQLLNRYTEANQSVAVQENKQATTPTTATDAISNAPCQQ